MPLQEAESSTKNILNASRGLGKCLCPCLGISSYKRMKEFVL